MADKNCPCGSGEKYENCCGPFIEGKAYPSTAEKLMRSRYTAYAREKIPYIIESHGPEGRDQISEEETRKWAAESKWMELKILNVQKGQENDTEGKVEFTAVYERNSLKHDHHEISDFKKIDGRWYFTDGRVISAPVHRAGEKVGRNDPCPCGSGKKYKKCCGA